MVFYGSRYRHATLISHPSSSIKRQVLLRESALCASNFDEQEAPVELMSGVVFQDWLQIRCRKFMSCCINAAFVLSIASIVSIASTAVSS